MAFSFPFQQSSPNPFQQQPQTPQQPQFHFQPQQPQFQTPQHPQQHYSLLPQPQQPYSLLPQPPQPQLQQQQGQQPTFLFKADRSPAGYNTKWEELHPDSQKILLQIEERILEYRNESQILDQCSRLFDSSVANNGFELDATRIIQELGGISIAIDREKVSAQELMTSVKSMMRNTEFAVRSFIILHPRFLHTRTAITSNGTVGSQTGGATSAFNAPIQPAASAMQPFDFYSGVPKRPSPFFTNTLAEFEKYLAQCRQWIEELEQLLHVDTKNTFATMGTSLESLPSVLSNVYDYFIYVAAKVENLHQYIESMKTAYLGDQRQQGDVNDPFLEADRREAAKLVAAARRTHPTLHLPAICSRPSQDAGLHVNSSIPMPSTVAHQPLGSTGASSGSGSLGLSVPSTAAASASTPSFLFSTPSSSAPTSTLFGSAGFSPHSTPLGSAQTPLFGASTPAFTSTPPVGSSSLFSTPAFGPGPTIGSGASFGGTSKSSKPRSRAPNRR